MADGLVASLVSFADRCAVGDQWLPWYMQVAGMSQARLDAETDLYPFGLDTFCGRDRSGLAQLVMICEFPPNFLPTIFLPGSSPDVFDTPAHIAAWRRSIQDLAAPGTMAQHGCSQQCALTMMVVWPFCRVQWAHIDFAPDDQESMENIGQALDNLHSVCVSTIKDGVVAE